jgi:hypothetical protein
MADPGDFNNMLMPQGAPQPAQIAAGMPGQFSGQLEPTPDAIQRMAVPPTGQDDLNRRIEGWKVAMEDPKIRNALLFFGAALMQPYAQNQTGAGHLGQALAVGAGAYNMTGVDERQAGINERKMKKDEAVSDAAIGASEERRRGDVQTREQNAARFGDLQKADQLRIEQLGLQIKNATTEDKVKNLEVEIKTLEKDLAQKYGADKAKLSLELIKAQTATQRASAYAAGSLSFDDTLAADYRKLSKKKDEGAKLTPSEEERWELVKGRVSGAASGASRWTTELQTRAQMEVDLADAAGTPITPAEGKKRALERMDKQFKLEPLVKLRDQYEKRLEFMTPGPERDEVLTKMNRLDARIEELSGMGTPAVSSAATSYRDPKGATFTRAGIEFTAKRLGMSPEEFIRTRGLTAVPAK